MSPKSDFFVPFSIPIWGVIEADHMHVNNHMNFLFHADAGVIMGASAYPVRDRFQFVKMGSVIVLHGAVK